MKVSGLLLEGDCEFVQYYHHRVIDLELGDTLEVIKSKLIIS